MLVIQIYGGKLNNLKIGYTVDHLIMRHLNYASKSNYLCIIVGSKFRANFLIMRCCPRAYAYTVRAHCLFAMATTATGVINCLGYSKWLWLQVMLDIGSSAACMVIMCTIGSGIQPSAKCWEQLTSWRTNVIVTL